MEDLTRNEQKVYDFVCKYIEENEEAPTRTEIAEGIEYKGQLGTGRAVVQQCLDKLEKFGYISLGRGWRNIKLK